MKKLFQVVLIIAVVAGISAAGYQPAAAYWKKRNAPIWRTAKVTRGDIVSVVNATGTVKPVLSVHIGSFVSGPILELHADHNQEVKKGALLAQVDPRIYAAAVARDEAMLDSQKADVERINATLQLAKNNESRAQLLHEENPDFVSQAELDQVHFARLELDAQLKLAEAGVKQASANLLNSKAQLDYTEIRAPVSGVVIDVKIDPGQTLAAQFQTPELFIVAPDMRERMHVYASVDEADIGLIRGAQEKGRPVEFMVAAYENELFEGAIEEIRFSSTETQNVVTYPVIVAAPNPDLKLLPGMTATISFEVDRRLNTIKVPNSALRFLPELSHVREADRKILEGEEWEKHEADEQPDRVLSAHEKAEARRKRNRRHVWIQDGEFLKAVEIVTGLSASRYTELVSGGLKEGDKLVTGTESKKSSWGMN
jgi:HlyD family secretion protein